MRKDTAIKHQGSADRPKPRRSPKTLGNDAPGHPASPEAPPGPVGQLSNPAALAALVRAAAGVSARPRRPPALAVSCGVAAPACCLIIRPVCAVSRSRNNLVRVGASRAACQLKRGGRRGRPRCRAARCRLAGRFQARSRRCWNHASGCACFTGGLPARCELERPRCHCLAGSGRRRWRRIAVVVRVDLQRARPIFRPNFYEQLGRKSEC